MSFTPTGFEVTPMRNSTVQYLYSRRHEIDMDPPYQRQGAVWPLEKQQLLIDSLINSIDIPKIYLHRYPKPKMVRNRPLRYALVDGRQRLEAIFGFIDGKFSLSKDFVTFEDGSHDAAGKTYKDLQEQDPILISDFQSTILDVMEIRASDVEMIEEMFSRLNEAVPLNAAEKRNALGGPLPKAVRTISEHDFFKEKLPFSNSRYRHFDLAAKFLYWQNHRPAFTRDGAQNPAIASYARDVKKLRLDQYFKQMKNNPAGQAEADAVLRGSTDLLDAMTGNFTQKDELLQTVGMVSVYYLLATVRADRQQGFPSRAHLVSFEEFRREKRDVPEEELSSADLVLMEFGRLAQSPNDGGALAYRLDVLDAWVTAEEQQENPVEAVGRMRNTEDK